MPRRALIGSVLAMVAAALFIRLGIWQLRRLAERQERNALIGQRLAAPPVPLDSAVTADTARLHFRRIRIRGRPDGPREFLLAGTSRNGSPGVNLLTPVILDGSTDAVLVDRGWVYSPDATTIQRERWAVGGPREFGGYVAEFAPARPAASGGVDRPGIVWRMDYAAIASHLPYRLAPFYVMELEDRDDVDPNGPARFPPPPLDEGPHRSYAFQWFAFAAMALAGGGVVLTRGRAEIRARHAATAEDVE